jgi:hypothetical protein
VFVCLTAPTAALPKLPSRAHGSVLKYASPLPWGCIPGYICIINNTCKPLDVTHLICISLSAQELSQVQMPKYPTSTTKKKVSRCSIYILITPRKQVNAKLSYYQIKTGSIFSIHRHFNTKGEIKIRINMR